MIDWQLLGPSALAGIVTVVVIFPLSGFIAKVRSKLQVSDQPYPPQGTVGLKLTFHFCSSGGSDEVHGQSDQADE